MNLTDEQVKTLAVCAYCQVELEPDAVRPMLESGELEPHNLACPDCTGGEAEHLRGLYRMWCEVATGKLVERMERAGLRKHYENVAREHVLRRDNRQN